MAKAGQRRQPRELEERCHPDSGLSLRSARSRLEKVSVFHLGWSLPVERAKQPTRISFQVSIALHTHSQAGNLILINGNWQAGILKLTSQVVFQTFDH